MASRRGQRILSGAEPLPAPAPEPRREHPGRFQVISGGQDGGQFRAQGISVRARDLAAATGEAAAEMAAITGAAEAENPHATGADIFADRTLAGIWDLGACSKPYRWMLMGAYLVRRRAETEDAHRAG